MRSSYRQEPVTISQGGSSGHVEPEPKHNQDAV